MSFDWLKISLQDAYVFLFHIAFKYCSLLLLLLFAVPGCKLGPNFHSPAAPQTTRYIQDDIIKKTVNAPEARASGKAQNFNLGQDISAEWWYVFHSTELNTLILAGLRNNASLAAAKAALINAQENYRAQVGNLFPTVSGHFTAERQRFSLTQFGGSSTGPVGANTFNLFNAYINAAYTLDVFGGIRRQIEAAGAQADYEQFELEAAFLTLSSNIATTAIILASLESQRLATNKLIRVQEHTLNLVKKQFALGGVSKSDVLLQENQLAQTKATLPPIKQNIAINKHILSTLIGELPTEHAIPVLNLDKLNLPTDLPLSCPSLLVRQRPDIRAAESLVHSASALIGVATANLFPQVTINGNYGQQSTSLGTLFKPQNNVWNITGAVAQTIFSGGTLLAQRRAAIAAYEQAAAQYKQTVLQAFQNVADVLRALQHDAQLLKAQKEAEIAALVSLNMIQKQFRLGGVSYLNLLAAERSYQEAVISRIQAQSARYTDTVALFQSLGGGWWNRCLLNCNPLLTSNLQQYRPEVFGRI